MAGARKASPTGAFGALVLMACLGLAGCQASSLDDGLGSTAASSFVPIAASTHGSGPVTVSMLLPTDAALAKKAADIADGARLALDELGDGQLRIEVLPVSSGSGEVAAKVQAATSAGSKLIIGPATDAQSASLGSTGQAHPPVLALVANASAGGSNIWPLYGDAIDSALEGVGVAVAAKQKNIVVVHEKGFPAENLIRLREGIRLRGGTTVGFVAYPADGKALREAFATSAGVFNKADTIVLLGGGEAIGQVIDILAAGEFGKSIGTAIATSLIPKEIYGRPSAQGLIVAMPSTSNLSVISERFKARYGREPSYDAAIGYDSVAIAAGLVRSGGPDAITIANLTSPQGFRGATGLFRFRPDGRIERRMVVHRIENGALTVLQEEGAGF